MIRTLAFYLAFLFAFALPVAAQDLTAKARVDPGQSHIEQTWFGRTEVRLDLSQGVPFRVFTLDDPARLVLDFREVDWSGVNADAILRKNAGVAAIRFGPFQPGWSRLVADLDRPMLPEEIGMALDDVTGRARLTLRLASAAAADFAAASGVPDSTLWPVETPRPQAASDDRFVVVIDPGHGGIDPGAERDGVSEKHLMLEVAFEVRAALLRAGPADVDVVLTRTEDVFVPLQARVAQAHHVGADLFLSLHADALPQGGAQGATVYLLSDAASDTASAELAARHNRADIIAGADLTGSDDEVTQVLLDLARQETEPRSEALAQSLIAQMYQAGGPMNTRPLRRAGFSVLKSADIPSALVEIGFLSSARDLQNLRDPVWRTTIAGAIAQAVLDWRDVDTVTRALVRQ